MPWVLLETTDELTAARILHVLVGQPSTTGTVGMGVIVDGLREMANWALLEGLRRERAKRAAAAAEAQAAGCQKHEPDRPAVVSG